MLISQLAQMTGVSVHALRHYERLGLIVPPRTAGGYRQYAESMRREVIFISMSRKIGFSLKDIAQRLPAYRTGKLTLDQMIEAMHERVAQIDAEVARLQTQRAQVVEHIGWLAEQKNKPQSKQPSAPKSVWSRRAATSPATPPPTTNRKPSR